MILCRSLLPVLLPISIVRFGETLRDNWRCLSAVFTIEMLAALGCKLVALLACAKMVVFLTMRQVRIILSATITFMVH